MSEIEHSFTVRVGDEVYIADERTVPVDGYGKFEVSVPKQETGTPGAATLTDVLPVDEDATPPDTSAIRCLVITADAYEDLSYSVDGGSTFRGLDQPIVLTARGAIDSFGIEDDHINFENAGSEDRTIRVIVGRSTS
jgi:hypothetical protein